MFWTRLTVIPTETSPATVPLSRVRAGGSEITVVPVLAVISENAPAAGLFYGPTTCPPNMARVGVGVPDSPED